MTGKTRKPETSDPAAPRARPDSFPDGASRKGKAWTLSPERDRLHGRHKGKRLRPAQRDLVETLLPDLAIPMPEGQPASLDPHTLFPGHAGPLWLEVGYGGGEHLVAQADANPGMAFIGCEFFLNGIAKILRAVDERGLADRVRLYAHDARDLIDHLADASLDRAFLLFPDPWPKARHYKRRFVQDDTLREMARVLKPGAEFRIASDIPDYVRWTMEHMHRQPAFEWLAERPADWRVRPDDWPGTRYEAKAMREGRVPAYLTFRRR